MNNPNAGRPSLEVLAQAKITERVEHIREQRGLSIRRMATRMDMNYSNLSHRLQGRVAWSVGDVLLIRRVWGEDVLEALP